VPRTTIDQLVEDARRELERVDWLAAREAIGNGAVLIDIRSQSRIVSDGVVPVSLALPRS
jgi:hypothetical protein